MDVVPQACDHSLKNLQIDYFDLYLMHFPICWKHTGLATPSWGKSELGDTPLIDTRHIVTNVLVNNGETVVLGGIYEHSKSHTIVRVPFISAIPIVGKLFKSESNKNMRKELLIHHSFTNLRYKPTRKFAKQVWR